MVVAGRADEYRRLAKRCLEMMRTVSSPDRRATLVDMAQVWLRLAEEQERAAQQQQQQIQRKDDDKKE